MADFHQNGIITTLHNLTDRSLDEIETELAGFSRQRPMALILPSLYSELRTPALPNIGRELQKVPLPVAGYHRPGPRGRIGISDRQKNLSGSK